VDAQELDRLVEEIGGQILARLGHLRPAAAPPPPVYCPHCQGGYPHEGAEACASEDAPESFDRRIAAMIDHTLLRADATAADLRKLCREARRYQFAAVCVNPYWAALAASELAGSPVKVCTVAGFPLGAHTTAVKVAETEGAIRVGAREIDMVLNVGELRGGNHDAVRQDIQAVVDAAHSAGAIVKVILETALLDDHQIAVACTLAKLAGAEFVKTSTGFSTRGATAHDVALMRAVVGPDMGVKASGGIRTLQDLNRMAAAGATRIGASASVRILEATARPAE
jgi:deoxyribose-phosphate aldolase